MQGLIDVQAEMKTHQMVLHDIHQKVAQGEEIVRRASIISYLAYLYCRATPSIGIPKAFRTACGHIRRRPLVRSMLRTTSMSHSNKASTYAAFALVKGTFC